MDKQTFEELKKKWSKILTKSWSDTNFLKKLKEHTRKTLVEEGIELAEGMNINVIEENHQEMVLVIPAKHSGEITDADLIRISGGLSNLKNTSQNQKQTLNRWQLEQLIVIQAIKDPEFKKKLLKDPKKTIIDFLKIDSKFNLEKVHVKIEQEKKDEWIIALPAFEHSGALSEQELKDLSGGTLTFLAVQTAQMIIGEVYKYDAAIKNI